MSEELQAWRFVDKFPTDKTAQLNWAIPEEKQRIVRTLIQKVVIGKQAGNDECWIEPSLSIVHILRYKCKPYPTIT